MTDDVLKPVPLTVSVKPEPPTVTVDGVMELITGGMMAIVSGTAVDSAKPGVSTVTTICRAEVRSLANTGTVSLLMPTNVVLRGEPSNETIDWSVKPLPLSVSVNGAPLTGAVLGLSDVTTGPPDASLTLKIAGPEVEPLMCFTVIGNWPTAATSAACSEIATCVELMNDICRCEPLKYAVSVLTKPLPLISTLTALDPAVTETGLRLLMTGASAATTVSVCAPEVGEPVPVLVTVICSEP